mgnify:CR=1 FL=1
MGNRYGYKYDIVRMFTRFKKQVYGLLWSSINNKLCNYSYFVDGVNGLTLEGRGHLQKISMVFKEFYFS